MAHAQHLQSRGHLMKASQESTGEITTVKPLAKRASKVSESMCNVHVNESDEEMEELNPSCCFICDKKHDSIESCMIHMHKQHGLFIPDIEYLKDPQGLLTYVGHKVKRDYACLYCNDRCHPFQSLEAIRMHIIAKAHCKLRYGDGGEDEDANLEDFYDYSSSYVGGDGKQLVVADDMAKSIELGSGGFELIITRKSDDRVVTRTLGSREFTRYYRQKPRPSAATNVALALSLVSKASRQQNMTLATVQSKKELKVLRAMSRNGVEVMRSKIGRKSNVIRNLPRNVTY